MNIDIQNKADSHNLNDWCVNSPLTLPVETVNEVRIESLNKEPVTAGASLAVVSSSIRKRDSRQQYLSSRQA